MMEVDELLIPSLCSVCLSQRDERQLALKRIQQSSYIKLTSGNQTLVLDIEVTFQLLSNRSAVETHEAEMHVDVTFETLSSANATEENWSHNWIRVASSHVFQPPMTPRKREYT